MSLTTDFIAELIRAANEADRLSPFEVKWLLNRSIATIRDMREQTGIRGSNRAKDVLIDLHVAAARAEDLTWGCSRRCRRCDQDAENRA